MNDLATLQAQFQEHLLDTTKFEIADSIVSTPLVSAKKRLGIYAYAYKARLLESFAASYPILKLLLGDKFETLGHAYIDAYPSPYRSIRWFGDKLDIFLQNHPSYKKRPELCELANVEWILSIVFDAQDALALTVEELSSIPPEDWMTMRFKIHPSLQRINFSWNTVQIWQALTDEKELPLPQQSSAPVPWIFWRHELVNKFCSLTESEAWAIDAMIQGATFEEICEGLCEWVDEDEVAVNAAGLLKGWILAGFIAGVFWD